MAIFNGYVNLPDGNFWLRLDLMIPMSHTSGMRRQFNMFNQIYFSGQPEACWAPILQAPCFCWAPGFKELAQSRHFVQMALSKTGQHASDVPQQPTALGKIAATFKSDFSSLAQPSLSVGDCSASKTELYQLEARRIGFHATENFWSIHHYAQPFHTTWTTLWWPYISIQSIRISYMKLLLQHAKHAIWLNIVDVDRRSSGHWWPHGEHIPWPFHDGSPQLYLYSLKKRNCTEIFSHLDHQEVFWCAKK